MRTNHWVLGGLAWMTAATLLAQEAKPAAPPRLFTEALARDVVLDPPAAATVKQDSINVRGLPAYAGEVVTHLKKGQTVTVLEQVTLAKPKKDEPADWSRIALPQDAKAYVFADFIDTNTMTVSGTRINVRGGPGENFSVLARLEKGAPVKEVRRTQGWIQIEPPTNAYGFVASVYLALLSPAAPPPASSVVPEPVPPPPAAAAPVEPVVTNTPAEVTNTTPPAIAAAPIVVPEPLAPPPTNNVPPAAEVVAPPPEPAKTDTMRRIVTREGYVRKTKSVQAPTDYELRDIRSGDLTEFLLPNDPNFKAYIGARVSVTGPEAMDHRWLNTPVLQVQTIFLMP
jgi:SH3-like domain-containing protein